MPQFYNDAIDDIPSYDVCGSFAGGQFSNAKARNIGLDQASLLQNFEVNVTGQAIKRRGTVQIGNDVGSGSKIRGLAFYDDATIGTFEVAASDTHIYTQTGGTWSQLGSGTFSGTNQVEIVQAVGLPCFCADTDIFRFNGAIYQNISSVGTDNKAPNNVGILIWFCNRLIAAGSLIKSHPADTAPVPDAVYFSDFLDPVTWGAADNNATQIRVGGGDGDPVVALVPWNNLNIAVLKRKSSWVVGGVDQLDPSNMTIQLVHNRVGCLAKRTAVQIGSDILFLSDDGVRSLTQVLASDQQHELEAPLSFPVQDIIERINWTAASNACATFWRSLYVLAIPVDSSTINNYILTFNSITSKWNGFWTGFAPSAFAIRKNSNVLSLMIGLGDHNKVIEYLDYVHEADTTDDTYRDYNAAEIPVRLRTRGLTFKETVNTKQGLSCKIEWNNSKGVATVTPVLDEEDQAETETFSFGGGGGFAIPFSIPFAIGRSGLGKHPFSLMRYPEFMDMQFDISCTDAGRKEFRQITSSAFINSTPDQRPNMSPV